MKEVENMPASLAADLIRVVGVVMITAAIALAVRLSWMYAGLAAVVGIVALVAVKRLRSKSQQAAYRLYLSKFDVEELKFSRTQSLSSASLDSIDEEITKRSTKTKV